VRKFTSILCNCRDSIELSIGFGEWEGCFVITEQCHVTSIGYQHKCDTRHHAVSPSDIFS
jgi:hypothetical protein